MSRCLLALCLLLSTAASQAAEPARVLVVGTYHFGNPGQDLSNVQAVDVTTPQRQAELQAVTDALAKFEPNLVAVEWPADKADAQYAQFLDGSLPPSSNEVVQLGYCFARQRGLKRVYGLDVDGDFPFEAVQAWAEANGKGQELGAALQQVQGITERITALQETHSIGGILREMNSAQVIDEGHGFYTQLLRYGKGDDQPGVVLNAAWAKRNLAICARLLQALQPGDRAVVFYGQGHAYLLRRCISETPGVQLIEANEFLPAQQPRQKKAVNPSGRGLDAAVATGIAVGPQRLQRDDLVLRTAFEAHALAGIAVD